MKKGSDFMVQFKQWLIDNEVPSKEGEAIRTERVEKILGIELKSQVERVRYLYSKNSLVRAKLQGHLMLPYMGDYSQTNFSRDFPRFKNSFETKLDFMEFCIEHSIEEIAHKFLEVSESFAVDNAFDNNI